MFLSAFRGKPVNAVINDHVINVASRQTLLKAALAQGMAFPNRCRVGACGTCKCRLLSGRVKALTDTGYTLSKTEIDQGYILACQSVPLSDVDIALESAAVSARKPPSCQNVVDAPKPRAAPAENAGVFDYLKFFLFHGIGLLSAVALLAGGPYITAGLLAVLAIFIFGDAISGDDTSTPHYRYPGILTAKLWLSLPLLILIVFAGVWSVSSGDPLGFGAWLSGLSSYDLMAARETTTIGQHVAGIFLVGLMIGAVGTVPAHELIHRTWDPVSMAIGRLMLAFSFDTVFSIEHVYGHHRYVSTEYDPATAPRGRNVYTHILVSTIKGNISAWKIESLRLQRKSLSLFSWHNAVLRGHALSLVLVALVWMYGGGWAAFYFVLCALWGKSTLEIVNYMEHYGIVRNPGQPVQPRHSWNTNKRVSSWGMFNLTRHSHHHAQGEVPYQDLKPYPSAPMMVNGYLTTFMVTLIPPLWHYLMTPKVLAWDRDFANAEERRLAAEANARSGIKRFRGGDTEITAS